jgi:raffinose/stachyose/melibiose transport system permease protein
VPPDRFFVARCGISHGWIDEMTEIAENTLTEPLAVPPAKRKARTALKVSLLWAVPAVAITLCIHYIAVGAGSWYAFTDWDGVSAHANFVGLDNFKAIFRDPTARKALTNTVMLAVSFVIVANVIGLLLALGLQRALKTRFFVRALFFAPVVLSALAVSYIWQYIFDFNGPLNAVLKDIGLGSWAKSWTGSPTWAIWTIWVVLVWQFSGLCMVLYLAGLEGIPTELNEAAAVDGASTIRRFRSVTLPLLAPAFTISLTLTMIMGLRVFDQVMALTGGGPVNASETLATQVYKQAFVSGRFGYSAATALLLTVLVLIVAMLQLWFLRSREEKYR